MKLIQLEPLRKIDDDKLIERTYMKMQRLNTLFDEGKMDKYWEEIKEVNSMIIELKRRNLKINKEELIKKILLK